MTDNQHIISSTHPFSQSDGDSNGCLNLTERRAPKRWPWFVWFLLKILGLYNSRRIVRRRQCHLCRLAVLQRRQRARGHNNACLYPGVAECEGRHGDDLDTDEEPLVSVVHFDDESPVTQDRDTAPTDGCEICQSLWWDGKGQYRPYSESDIGVHRWNHPGSTVLSLVWLSVLAGLMMYYFRTLFGHYLRPIETPEQFVSITINGLLILFSPLFSLLANVCNMVADYRGTGWRRGFIWYKALGVRYIVKRLQHLELDERGLPYKAYLVLCLLWPCWKAALAPFAGYIGILWKIYCYGGTVCMIVWGAFCYLILLMRLSFQRQMRLELAFLWRHAGALDVCRRRLAVYAEELGIMYKLASVWIIVVVILSTWALGSESAIHIQYLNSISQGNTERLPSVDFVRFLIGSDLLMFFVLPLIAIGGFSMHHVWINLELSINEMRCAAQDDFWDKILAFCKKQSPVTKVKVVKIMFSASMLYFALHVGQHISN